MHHRHVNQREPHISPFAESTGTTPRAFLDRLTEATRAEVLARGVQRKWPRHTSIFRMREECSGVHILLDGLVKLYRSNASGKEQIILLEGAGGALTITPMIDDGTHLASAETLKPSTTLFISRQDFLEIHHARADFREAVVAEMARRFRALVGLLETISLKPVPARVATRLIELASAHEALDGTPFTMMLSQDELAHVLATSRESIARSLADLRSEGVIEQRGSKIRVVDAQALFQMSQVVSAENATPLPVII